jgi:hypothetical protein
MGQMSKSLQKLSQTEITNSEEVTDWFFVTSQLTPTTPSFKSSGIWDSFCEHNIAKRRHSQFLHRILASVF